MDDLSGGVGFNPSQEKATAGFYRQDEVKASGLGFFVSREEGAKLLNSWESARIFACKT
jgi:hypothetical protein